MNLTKVTQYGGDPRGLGGGGVKMIARSERSPCCTDDDVQLHILGQENLRIECPLPELLRNKSTGPLAPLSCKKPLTVRSTHLPARPPNSPTHQTRIVESGEKWGGMGNNVGKCGKRGGGGEIARSEDGMWLRNMGQKRGVKWEKMGGKWEEIPIFHSPVLPHFPEVEDLPHSSLC